MITSTKVPVISTLRYGHLSTSFRRGITERGSCTALLSYTSFYQLRAKHSIDNTVKQPFSIRQQLIGSWELLDYSAHAVHNLSDKHYPLGPNADGILIYTPDGYMSVQMLTPGIKPFELEDGTDAQWAEAGRKCHAYTGPFYLDEHGDAQGCPVLVHDMTISNMPHFKGLKQRRLLSFSEDESGKYLTLRTAEPLQMGGKQRSVELKCRKLPVNEKLPSEHS